MLENLLLNGVGLDVVYCHLVTRLYGPLHRWQILYWPPCRELSEDSGGFMSIFGSVERKLTSIMVSLHSPSTEAKEHLLRFKHEEKTTGRPHSIYTFLMHS